MCGRLTITTQSRERIQTAFPWLDVSDWRGGRFNVAPSQDVAAVLSERPDALAWVRWGFVPRWSKDGKAAMINARAETLAEKPSFRDAYKRRRCLILADGFFEWEAVPGQKQKQPHYFRLRGGDMFAFAGLFEAWTAPDGTASLGCCIITTAPNELLAKIHDRMPVILTGDRCQRWLAAGPPQPDLLASYPAERMESWKVATLVNNARLDDSRCVDPVALNGKPQSPPP